MPWTRYEVETRWRENGWMLAWGYVGERSRKESAIELRDRLFNTPRKVEEFDCRIIEIVRGLDGHVLKTTILPNETQLTFNFIPEEKFVSGLPARN